MRTWCGSVEAQRETRSSPRHRLGLNRTNTATDRRHGLRNFVVTAFGSRGARPAHSPPCGEYRPTVHEARAAQCVFGVGCVVGQREERSSPSRWLMLDCTNTATGRGHRLWDVVAAAREFRDVQSARFPLHGVSVDNPRSTGRAVRSSHGCVVGQHRARFSPRRRTGARPHQYHGSSVARASEGLKHCFQSRGARPARFRVVQNRSTATEHAPRSAHLVWLC